MTVTSCDSAKNIDLVAGIVNLTRVPPDYLIVSETYELRSLSANEIRTAPPRPLCEFRVTQSGRDIGRAEGWRTQAGVRLDINAAQPIADADLAELYRLLARVCGRLTQHALPLWISAPPARGELAHRMARDGFVIHSSGYLVRGPGPFVVAESAKVNRSEDVYRDPCCVPWNLVPREWDVLGKVAADFGVPIPDGSGPPGKAAVRRARVLDLGCGYGKNASALEELGFEVFGIDLSPAAIARCRQIVRNPARFLSGSATQMPWSSGSFGAVLDIGCVHCMPADLRPGAIKEIVRVLRPSGVLYSRSFKPRPELWLRLQPFKAASFGLPARAMCALLATCFDTSIWQDDEDMNYVMGRPKHGS